MGMAGGLTGKRTSAQAAMFDTDLEAEIQADCRSGEQQCHAAGAAEGMKMRPHFAVHGMSSAVSVQNVKFSSGQSATQVACMFLLSCDPHTLSGGYFTPVISGV